MQYPHHITLQLHVVVLVLGFFHVERLPRPSSTYETRHPTQPKCGMPALDFALDILYQSL